MKPFYLNGNTDITLDGPALRVQQPAKAVTLYPLSRISRVIVTTPVNWSTEALLACAERGITITFLNTQGDILAYMFGDSKLRTGLFNRLQDLLDRPDWRERYSDWYRSMESRARRSLARRLNLPPEPLPPAPQLLAVLNALTQRFAAPSLCRHIDRRLQGMLAALVAELLAEAGLSAEQARSFADRLQLTEDLVRLLAWDLHLPILDLLRQQGPEQLKYLEDIELARLFESRSFRLRKLGRTVLNRLHGWLVELLK